MTSTELRTDADLVTASLSGDREAFGWIVERYQRLLCSLAYSATGDLAESEDLAQEAFVDAWRQLHALREPDKLRAWLCGILRYKIGRQRRSEHREPVRRAEAIEEAEGVASNDEPTADLAMGKEEQAILWSALGRVPKLYRDPLVLYYREHRSVEHVAVALELTEDAVKQRLARGRKVLQEQVLAFVEGALSRSTPGRLFTLGVLAALPAASTPVHAAGIGAAAAQGGWVAKSTGILPLLGSISGAISTVLALRASLDQARTGRERRAVVKITVALFFGALGFLVVLYLLRHAAMRAWFSPWMMAVVAQGVVLTFCAGWPIVVLRTMRRMRAMRTEERRQHPELFSHPRDRIGAPEGFYRSRQELLGIPLVHLRFSSPEQGEPPVVGWLAGGDRAYGIVAAWGGLAVAPVSIGAVAVGLVSVGSLSFGFISVGTAAIGVIAFGCMAVGIHSGAWLSAMGWHTAQGGGFAIAQLAAQGQVAFAPHANDAVARRILTTPHMEQTEMMVLVLSTLFSLIPIALYARAVRRRMGGRK